MQSPDFALARRWESDGDSVLVRYALRAEAGYRFLWAAHALLDVSEQGVVGAAEGTRVRVYPDEGADYVEGPWPAPWREVGLDRLGPDDGSALGAILTGGGDVTVVDGADVVTFALRAPAGVPVSVALWRNLGGFPVAAPYRSIGVEPMLGAVFDLAAAGPNDAAMVPSGGEIRWELLISAGRLRDAERDAEQGEVL